MNNPEKTPTMVPIPTPRLMLRSWEDGDFPVFAAMNADPRVMEYFPMPLTEPESAEFFARIRRETAAEDFGLYALERRSDGEMLGFTGLHRVSFPGELHGRIEICWRLRAGYWDCGYATEAANACLAHARTLGIRCIVAFTFRGNQRSQRVMQRLGMTFTGEFEHPALPAGHPLLRHVLYRIEL